MWISCSKALRAARIKASLSQRDVANRLGYSSAQFVSNWERAISRPPNSAFRELADLFKVPVTKLVNAAVEDLDNETKRWRLSILRGR